MALPIAPGDTVAIVGRDQRPLLESIVKAGATPVLVADAPGKAAMRAPAGVSVESIAPGDALPLADGGVDHVIFMALHAGWRGVAASEIARVCRPGGSVVIVVPNRSHRFRDPAAWHPGPLVRHLESHGLHATGTYGVRQDVTDIRHLVPLGAPSVWYVRNAAASSRWRAALEGLLAAPDIPALMLPTFPALAVTARREVAPC